MKDMNSFVTSLKKSWQDVGQGLLMKREPMRDVLLLNLCTPALELRTFFYLYLFTLAD
jgi:hypothetical protein